MGLRTFKVMGGLTALGVVLGATAASAQQAAPPATNHATPVPTPTPTPGAIGNPSLQNFNLDGTVTREATPAPAPAQPPAARPAPADSAPATAAPRDTSATTSTSAREAGPGPSASAPARDAAPADTASALPSDIGTSTTPVAADPSAAPDLMPPAPVEPSGGGVWPWLAAFALALGAAAVWWWRRQRGGAEELAFASHAPDAAAPAPQPRAAPEPAPTPAPAPRAAAPSFDGGIVSRALQPKLAFELRPLKFETDDKHSARLTFELVVVNVGSAPARDIRVEAKMFNAGVDQDRQIASFFRAPSAMGAKLPPIGPQDRVPLRSRIGMTAADYQALALGGRSLVVPMIAVNAVYRGSAGETQESASWLVGALPSGGDAEKLRPFPLDKPVATTALAARVHSAGIAA